MSCRLVAVEKKCELSVFTGIMSRNIANNTPFGKVKLSIIQIRITLHQIITIKR